MSGKRCWSQTAGFSLPCCLPCAWPSARSPSLSRTCFPALGWLKEAQLQNWWSHVFGGLLPSFAASWELKVSLRSCPVLKLFNLLHSKNLPPWLGLSVGWNVVLYTKGLWVRACTGDNWSMFLSLSFSLISSDEDLKKNHTHPIFHWLHSLEIKDFDSDSGSSTYVTVSKLIFLGLSLLCSKMEEQSLI